MNRYSSDPGSAFDAIAARYDEHAALEAEAGRRLVERCAFLKTEPQRIIDVGCGTGVATAALKRRFRKAQVIGLDRSPAMLRKLRARSGLVRPLRPVCADLAALPFPYASADLLFSNLASFWSPDPVALYDEYRRVLRPGGMLLFTVFGPDSLAELREAAGLAEPTVRLPRFADLLEVGDALVAAGFAEPVMDVERITLEYRALDDLLGELERTGTALLVDGWERLVRSGVELEQAYRALRSSDRYPLSFEIVFGAAFGPREGQPRRGRDGEVATFSVDSLLKSRRVR